MNIPELPVILRRARRAARLACGAAALILVAAAPALGRAGEAPVAGPATVKGATAGLSLEALTAQAGRQQQELQRLETELLSARKAQAQGEQAAAHKAQTIEQLKSEPPGVARDLRLQELLAQAQAQAGVLSQQATELRAREAGLRSGRERLVLTCDQLLAADSGGKLPLAQRLSFLRLRTAQVEALHGAADRESLGRAVRTAVQAGAALAPEGSAEAAGGDDPRTLRERADLLRDSADKLRREVQRLKLRGDELGHRQRLRERAARVDEDLFAEQTKSRHLPSGARDGAGTTLQESAPAPAAPGSTPTVAFDSLPNSPPSRSVDPSTFDILQRAESLTDPVAKLQALQRAQTELGTLTEQLLARAARLEHQAEELARKK